MTSDVRVINTAHQRKNFWADTRIRAVISKTTSFLMLLVFALFFLMPIVYMLSTALKKPGSELLWPPTWFEQPLYWSNFQRIFELVPFGRYILNSIIVTGIATFGAVLSASMAAFAFARLPFRGRGVLFSLMIITMLVPMQVMIIPQFLLFSRLGWIDTFYPLIVPPFFGGGAWAIFLLTQFFRTLPQDLVDAAEVDGASPLQIYWHVFLPLSRPALATVVVLFFMTFWNDFLSPLIYVRQPELLTVPVGLAAFHSAGLYLAGAWTALMAASAVSIIPILVIFLFTQRYFVQGMVRSGLKG